jgi:hypothetical protein
MTYDVAHPQSMHEGASISESRLPRGVNQTTLNQAAPKVDISLFNVKCVDVADGRMTITSR